MRIVYATDLHGKTERYDKLLNVAIMSEANIIVVAGDMLPTEGRVLLKQDSFINGYLSEFFSFCCKHEIHFVGLLGNDDLTLWDELFVKTCDQFPYVHNVAQGIEKVLGYEFIGCNMVLDYPFKLKDRCVLESRVPIFPDYDKSGFFSKPKRYLQEILDWDQVRLQRPTMQEILDDLPKPTTEHFYVIHQPPLGVGLDITATGKAVGSRSVTKFIEDSTALASFHGHIHESPIMTGIWNTKLNGTEVYQVGSSNKFLSNVVLDILDGTISIASVSHE